MTAGDVVGIGSPRASLESNLALRARVGAKNFYAGFSAEQQRCVQAVIAVNREQGLHCPDIRTLEQADCVLLVNEDITNTSPRFALALRCRWWRKVACQRMPWCSRRRRALPRCRR